MRDAKGARETLDQSLEYLKTDYFDVFQLHAVTDVEEDVKASYAKGGPKVGVLSTPERPPLAEIISASLTPLHVHQSFTKTSTPIVTVPTIITFLIMTR